MVGAYRYRLIDDAGSELGIIEDDRSEIGLGETVNVPETEGGGLGRVVDVYSDDTALPAMLLVGVDVDDTPEADRKSVV